VGGRNQAESHMSEMKVSQVSKDATISEGLGESSLIELPFFMYGVRK
jgi:hypothetical protein